MDAANGDEDDVDVDDDGCVCGDVDVDVCVCGDVDVDVCVCVCGDKCV